MRKESGGHSPVGCPQLFLNLHFPHWLFLSGSRSLSPASTWETHCPFLFRTELSLSPHLMSSWIHFKLRSQDLCPHLCSPATKDAAKAAGVLFWMPPSPDLSLTLEAVGRAGVQGGWIASRGQHTTGFQPAHLEDWREAVTILEGGAQIPWVHPTLDLPLPGPLYKD